MIKSNLVNSYKGWEVNRKNSFKKPILNLLIKFFLATNVLFFCLTAYGEIEDVKIETTGYGETYREALINALLDSVSQVRGLQVSTKEFLNIELQQIIKDDAVSISSQKIGEEERIASRAKGWLTSYRILSAGKDKKNGHWVVEVSAVVPKSLDERIKDTRKTLAVMPFRFSQPAFLIFDKQGNQKSLAAASVSIRLADQLRVNLSNLGKFSIINRQFGPEVVSEKALLSTELVSPSEAANLGNILGADYMLLGRIYRFESIVKSKDFYGSGFKTVKDEAELYYQIVDSHTQKIIWADSLEFHFDKERQLSLEEKLSDEDRYSGLMDTLNALSDLISGQILMNLYPPKVVSISGDKVFISHGARALSIGNLIDVFKQGKMVNDPDTGRSLLLEGELIAQLEIVKLQPEYAVAKLVNGDISQIDKKVILRRKPVKDDAEEENEKRYSTPGDSDAPVSW